MRTPRTSISRLTSVVLALATAACGPSATRDGGGGGDGVDAGGGDGGSSTSPGDGPQGGCQKIDVLFVIDNSGSMGQEQANLIANFPSFITVLNQSGLDYRVAVTTTSREYAYTMAGLPINTGSGEDGAMLQPAGCNMTKRWIDRSDPDPVTTFSCVANIGTGGNNDEMPLGAMRDAFEDRMQDGTNVGFRRADALLGVVFLTDEEDCSYEQSVSLGFGESLCDDQMEPVANYVAFLDLKTGHRSRWAAAAIAGPGPGTCSSTFGTAEEATRLKEFVSLAGAQAHMSSICDGDLSASLEQTLALFASACGGIIL